MKNLQAFLAADKTRRKGEMITDGQGYRPCILTPESEHYSISKKDVDFYNAASRITPELTTLLADFKNVVEAAKEVLNSDAGWEDQVEADLALDAALTTAERYKQLFEGVKS